MGGGESQSGFQGVQGVQALSLDPTLLDEYSRVNPAEAARLKEIGTPAALNGRIYGRTMGEDITDIYRSYESWASQRNTAIKSHNDYVAKTLEQPGRKATLLVPYSAPEAKTLLGGVNMAPKTLLGG